MLHKHKLNPSTFTTSSSRLPKVLKIQRSSFKHTHSSDKTRTSIQPCIFPNKNYTQNTKFHSFIHPNDIHESSAILKIEKGTSGVKNKYKTSNEIIDKRQQQKANFKFNRRMNILKQITKENQKLFERINSQKSLYSKESMRKSTVSIRSSSSKARSRCIAKGKNSERQIGRQKNKKCNINMQSCIPVTIQPQSISKIKQPIIDQFKSMFLRVDTHRKCSRSYAKKQNRSLSMKQQKTVEGQKEGMGSMLHRIAEVMFKTRQRTIM